MLELMVAAALAAPCKPPERARVVEATRNVVVYREGRRTKACGRGGHVTLHPRPGSGKRLLAVRVAGRHVAAATGDGEGPRRLTEIRSDVLDVGTRKVVWDSVQVFDRPAGRVAGLALSPSGEVATAVHGPGVRGIHVRNRHGSFAVERRVNAALGSLKAERGRFVWRYRGAPQSVPVGTPPPSPPADCTIPPAAIVMARFPAVVYALSAWQSEGRTVAYGCLPGDRPRELDVARVDPMDYVRQEIRFVAVRPPFAALDFYSGGWKHTSTAIRVFDLRSGARVLEGCLRGSFYTGYQEPSFGLGKAVLSASGRLGCSLTEHHGRRLYEATISSQAPGEERIVHEQAADVDPQSLRVEGSELVWTRAGARRSAGFP